MKRLAILSVVLTMFLFACQNNKNNQKTQNAENQPISEDILTGKIERIDFLQPPYKDWFEQEYTSYQVDEQTLENINKDELNNLKIVIVMGTWCPDSQREVPRFYKIIDFLAIPSENITLIAVPKPFKGFELIKNYDIERVPTFIFYKNGKELGRIIEKPQQTLEKDMLEILK